VYYSFSPPVQGLVSILLYKKRRTRDGPFADPPSIPEEKTPPTFFYRTDEKLEWLFTEEGLLPILLEELLTPQNIHLLLPLLAHHLAWYNNDALNVASIWDGYPEDVESFPPAWVMLITGNFLWLPVLFKNRQKWESWLIKRVYKNDEFAVWLGQGPALEHILRHFNEELKRRRLIDCGVPTLISRCGQLEVLNRLERDARSQAQTDGVAFDGRRYSSPTLSRLSG
jgi:hypothetical protein